MIVTYIRSSSYNNYDFCQMQYFLTYVLGYRSDSNKKADLGTMAHKVMEILAGLKKFQQDNPKRKYLVIEDDKCGKIRITKDELYTDEFVERMCELAVTDYAKGSIHNFTKGDRKVVRDTVFTFLNHSDSLFDPRQRNIYHPEAQFDIPIEEDWAKFEYEIEGKKVSGQLAIKGTIDLTTLIGDDTIEVIDWKSGRRMDWITGEVKDYKKLEQDPQLLLYFYAISKLYKDFPNRIMSIFFYKDKDGKVDPMPFSICLGPEDEKRFLKMLRKQFEGIRDNVSPKPLKEDRSHWKCTKLCHFYKNNWEGTDTPICVHVGNKLKADGMKKTVKDCTKKGFSIGYYEAPG